MSKSVLLSDECYKKLTKVLILIESNSYDDAITFISDFKIKSYSLEDLTKITQKLLNGKKTDRRYEKVKFLLEMYNDLIPKEEEKELILKKKMEIEEYLNGQKKAISNDLHKEQIDLPEPSLK